MAATSLVSRTRPLFDQLIHLVRGDEKGRWRKTIVPVLSGVAACAVMLRLKWSMWGEATMDINSFPYLVLWYCVLNSLLTIACAACESQQITTSERFSEYPRWSTSSTAWLHLLVHAPGAWVLLVRVFGQLASNAYADSQKTDAESVASSGQLNVSPVEVHILAAAVASMFRDFSMFRMDWSFWMHHFIVVALSVITWLCATRAQWVLASFVCGMMEFGSLGYDVFILAANPLGFARIVYQFLMHTSHVLTLTMIAAYAFLGNASTWFETSVFWSLSPIIFVFVIVRHGATGGIIEAERKRVAASMAAAAAKVSDAAAIVSDEFEKTRVRAASAASDAAAIVSDAASDAAAKVSDVAYEARTKVSDAASRARACSVSDLRDAASDACNNAAAKVSDAASDAAAKVSDAKQRMSDAAYEAKAKVSDAASDAAAKVWTPTKVSDVAGLRHRAVEGR